jgi:hypothetical protein
MSCLSVLTALKPKKSQSLSCLPTGEISSQNLAKCEGIPIKSALDYVFSSLKIAPVCPSPLQRNIHFLWHRSWGFETLKQNVVWSNGILCTLREPTSLGQYHASVSSLFSMKFPLKFYPLLCICYIISLFCSVTLTILWHRCGPQNSKLLSFIHS